MNVEMWFVQAVTNPDCGSLGTGNVCWVEVGLSAGADSGGCVIPTNETHYFWADNRPNGGFFCHDMGPVSPAEFGHNTIFGVSRDTDQPNSFRAFALAQDGRLLQGVSTANTMVPDTVQIGMEVTGNSGTQAGTDGTTFTLNWFSNNPNNPSDGQIEKTDGFTFGGFPPVRSGWTRPPSKWGSAGEFFVMCCG